MFKAFRSTPAFFTALAFGSLGTGATYVAVMLVAYDRLGSAWATAAVLLAEMLPGMLAGPLIGAWLDRRDRRRCAIAADAVRAGALAALIVAPGAASLLAVAMVTGLAATVFRPAAFALLPADQRAVSLWGALDDAGLMVGPALAAGALVLGGTPLLLGGVAALFAGSALLFGRVRCAAARDETEESLVEGARAGLRAVRADRVLRVLVSATGVIVLSAAMMNVAEVLLARHELRVGSTGFAAMVAVFGIGAVSGSVASGRSDTVDELKRGYLAGLVLLAAGLVGSAIAPNLACALVSFLVTGFGNSLALAHDRGLLQRLAPAHMLSRVHALVGTIEAWGFAGAALVGGTLATVLGARGVFAVSGVALVLVAAVAVRALRPPPEFLPTPTAA